MKAADRIREGAAGWMADGGCRREKEAGREECVGGRGRLAESRGEAERERRRRGDTAARWGEGLYSRTSGSHRQRGRGKEKRRRSDGEMKEGTSV